MARLSTVYHTHPNGPTGKTGTEQSSLPSVSVAQGQQRGRSHKQAPTWLAGLSGLYGVWRRAGGATENYSPKTSPQHLADCIPFPGVASPVSLSSGVSFHLYHQFLFSLGSLPQALLDYYF